MTLLVGSVARPHQRTRENRAEAECFALLAEPAELVGVHPAVDLGVFRRGLEVLADRDDVDVVRTQVAQRLDDLAVRLPKSDDDPRLRQDGIAGELLRARE